MARLSQIATDTEKAADGTWIEYCPAMGDDDQPLELKIARLGNPAYNQRLQALIRPHRRKVRAGFEGELEPFVKQAVAEHCLVDWRGMYEDTGKEVKYSREMSVEILTDPRYSDLYDFVMDFAGDASAYREIGIEESAGNSPACSPGSSTTAKTKKNGKS
tara:strand:+ start:8343 stop:8822 length:480 start_codon:yes stop_codon:yes gene_type:complete